VLPIWTAVNKAIASKRVTRITSEMSELAVHISARLNVLPRVIVRLNSEEASLLAAVKESYGPKHAYTIRGEGTTIFVDNNLKYKLIADIDSLLSEVNSCTDLMCTFFGLLHNHAGRPISPDKLARTLRDALAKQGVSGGWFKLLDRHRNFVAHGGTPYLAVDISDAAWELLVMKENIREFVDAEKYFRFSELREIVDGFARATAALQVYLVALYK